MRNLETLLKIESNRQEFNRERSWPELYVQHSWDYKVKKVKTMWHVHQDALR